MLPKELAIQNNVYGETFLQEIDSEKCFLVLEGCQDYILNYCARNVLFPGELVFPLYGLSLWLKLVVTNP